MISREHQGNRFTTAEMADLMSQGRVFATLHEPQQYPFIVFAEPVNPARFIADGWRVDANGTKDPDLVPGPAPVPLSEVVHVDAANPEQRRALWAYTNPVVSTESARGSTHSGRPRSGPKAKPPGLGGGG